MRAISRGQCRFDAWNSQAEQTLQTLPIEALAISCVGMADQ